MMKHRTFADGQSFLACWIATAALLTFPPRLARAQCVGDCDGDASVTISEVISGVNIALETLPLTSCEAFDRNSDRVVSVEELTAAVAETLHGCPVQPTLQLSVTDSNGVPIEDFLALVSERGERRTTEQIITSPTSTVRYPVEDSTATIVVRVIKSEFHDEIAFIEPTTVDQALEISLVPDNECLPMGASPPDPDRLCPEPSGSDQFVPCEVIVGFDSRLTDGELEAIVTRYCVDFSASGFGPQSLSMWVDVVNADVDSVLEWLNADPRVAWAKDRGWPDGKPAGMSLLVHFGAVGLNEASDLIDSIPGVNWLQTIRSPQAVVVEVDPGTETLWASQLQNAPGARYAHLNGIVRLD